MCMKRYRPAAEAAQRLPGIIVDCKVCVPEPKRIIAGLPALSWNSTNLKQENASGDGNISEDTNDQRHSRDDRVRADACRLYVCLHPVRLIAEDIKRAASSAATPESGKEKQVQPKYRLFWRKKQDETIEPDVGQFQGHKTFFP